MVKFLLRTTILRLKAVIVGQSFRFELRRIRTHARASHTRVALVVDVHVGLHDVDSRRRDVDFVTELVGTCSRSIAIIGLDCDLNLGIVSLGRARVLSFLCG